MVNTNDLKLTFCTGVALAGMLLPASLFAGTETATSKEVKPITEPVKSAITGDLGVQFVSAYFSRGISLENQGVIAQPYADIYFDLFDGTDFINKVSLNLSVWSSLHSHHPGNTGGTVAWYEFDYTPGIAVTFAKNFTLTTSYFEFDSPNDSFAPARSINLNLSYDDSALLKAFALHPHVTYLRELGSSSKALGAGFAGLHRSGNYYEVGVTPALPALGPVTVSLPVTTGLGSSQFYKGTTLGYVSAGVSASMPLSFIPARYGAWTLSTGATYYKLSGQVAAADGGRHHDWVFNGGVGCAF